MADENRILKITDRCDVGGCSAQSFVMSVFTTGELHFCRHHYLSMRDALHASAVGIVDETEFINVKSESSA